MYRESTILLSKRNMNPLRWTLEGKSLPEEGPLDFPANSSELGMGAGGGGDTAFPLTLSFYVSPLISYSTFETNLEYQIRPYKRLGDNKRKIITVSNLK